MKQLDDLGWINEECGAYIQKAADAYIAVTDNGTNLDRCIAISPTWEENHRFTAAVRKDLKARNVIGEGVSITVCNPLDWTEEQKKISGNYFCGMFVTLSANVKEIPRDRTLEIEKIESGELWFKGFNSSINVNAHAKKLSVSLPQTIEISNGDKILIRRNHRKAELINGKVLTVDKINADGSIETREGKTIPAGFKHYCHGYVVTSHKSQGRTHDQVVIAAERLDAKAAYVACSRGRQAAHVFTPDKTHLFENLGTPSDRTAATDVLEKLRDAFWRKEESRAFSNSVNDHLSLVAINHANRVNHANDFQFNL
jgi:hypothetical protein